MTMRSLRTPSWIAGALALILPHVAAPLEAIADEYHVDPVRTEIVARVFKDGVASGFAHDHVVRAPKVSGTVRVDPKNTGAASISIAVDVDAFVIDEPEMRRKYK